MNSQRFLLPVLMIGSLLLGGCLHGPDVQGEIDYSGQTGFQALAEGQCEDEYGKNEYAVYDLQKDCGRN